MTEPREVTILIGKKLYTIYTVLDKPTFERVAAIVKGVSASLKNDIGQDNLLMLTCMQLAYGLEQTMGKLAPLADALENLEPWEPATENDRVERRNS
ncbi:MAG: hypothetical protein LBR71_00200 [Synergistaceae bacterium]|nr:hypothetical protein [Synergistaceae bacterium]